MRQFIETILGDQSGNAVMAIATGRTETGKLRVDRQQWFRYPEELDAMVEYAERKRAGDQRNVYISPLIYGDKKTVKKKPNGEEYSFLSRAIGNAVSSNVIYMDSDLCPPEKFRLAPSIHVNTSEGHGHDYWLLTEPIAAKEAAEIAHRITTTHKDDGCDPSGWSANKLLRMPTVNTKDPEAPWEITWDDTAEVYTLDELRLAYPDAATVERVKSEIRDEPIDEDIPPLEDLPDHETLLGRIPQSERRLNDLIFKKPLVGEAGWRSEQRYALLLDLQRFGFSIEETVSIAWHSPAARKWRDDQRGVEGLWMEARKAQTEVYFERGTDAGMSAATELEAVKKTVERLELLVGQERLVAGGAPSWMDEYLAWAKLRLPVLNEPYHRMLAWMVLSSAFAGTAYAPKPSGRMHLNIYSFVIGGSSSGKTDALHCMWDVIRAIHPSDDPDIGGNHSDTALTERILGREGKVSFTWNDEADGTLATWKQGGWSTGVQSTITKLYDGFVPQLSRVGKVELQKPNARAYVLSLMMGTPEGMFQVLDRGMFRTGFLARQLWAIGDEIPVTKDSLRTSQQAVATLHEEDPIPKLWADRFQRTITMLRGNLPAGHQHIPMLFTEEALARFDEAKWAIHTHFAHHPEQDVFLTSIRRLYDIMWKAAALLALSEGSRWITRRHVLAMLEHAEEWIFSLQTVAARISSSAFSRACDEIEQFIASHDKQRADAAKVYKLRSTEPVRITDEYLQSLIRQGRLVEQVSDHRRVYHIPSGRPKATPEKAQSKATTTGPRAGEEDYDDNPF